MVRGDSSTVETSLLNTSMGYDQYQRPAATCATDKLLLLVAHCFVTLLIFTVVRVLQTTLALILCQAGWCSAAPGGIVCHSCFAIQCFDTVTPRPASLDLVLTRTSIERAHGVVCNCLH